jgi:threonine aldolase
MRFYSDNTATVCPELLNAIEEANEGFAQAYGDDPWTQRLDEVFSRFFDTPVRAFPVATGTAANALALATLTAPYGAIFTHEFSHVLRDECGAPSFFSGGAQLVPVPGTNGKLTAQALEVALDANPPSVHSTQPAVVSLTQATEAGTVYRPSEIAALSELAHSRGLKVHMDGARLANALVFLDCHPADITARVGVDVLSFGATKNGALAAEAVIFFDRELARDFELRRKRAGHLFSKFRYVSAQLLAYVETGVWKRNAQRANALARTLGKSARGALMYPVESNQVFLRLDQKRKQALRDRGFEFFDWGAKDSDEVRLVVSWNQPEQDVQALASALESICV